jgi:hypothetical protein
MWLDVQRVPIGVSVFDIVVTAQKRVEAVPLA